MKWKWLSSVFFAIRHVITEEEQWEFPVIFAITYIYKEITFETQADFSLHNAKSSLVHRETFNNHLGHYKQQHLSYFSYIKNNECIWWAKNCKLLWLGPIAGMGTYLITTISDRIRRNNLEEGIKIHSGWSRGTSLDVGTDLRTQSFSDNGTK